MVVVETRYIAAGGNRHPAAADWDPVSGLVAFGADRNVAIWEPLGDDHQGIRSLLSGHTDKVNVVRFFPTTAVNSSIIISGSVDHSIRVWRSGSSSFLDFTCVAVLVGHINTINAISVAPKSNLFASGSADATVKIWRLRTADEREVDVTLEQTIKVTPRFFPLAVAIASLPTCDSLVLAVAGTRSIIQIYVKACARDEGEFCLQATLAGHEGWIRSLSFTEQNDEVHQDMLLASASQDKYIRLWRIRKGEDLPAANPAGKATVMETLGKALSNKAHRLKAAAVDFSITFEALLLEHADWIYTATWRNDGDKLQLLSASADNSLAIWECDSGSGVWVCATRLGEVSAQKGSTTATGSMGGFWSGLWSSQGRVVGLGRTGGFRLWTYAREQDRWLQDVAVSGHVKEVTGLAWSKDGDYLLSTSADQTTRLHAEWRGPNRTSWHEFARPQIHGYDLNCIDTLGQSGFVSGADEKLLRVFEEPKAIARLLRKLCGIEGAPEDQLPETANIPVLGLSNKAVQGVDDHDPTANADQEQSDAAEFGSGLHKASLELDKPPFEDHLARQTLWPESEKLYGHGFEISTVAASNDGTLIATACRASSIQHAVIRIYETTKWREIKPPLTAHSLTVTRLQFSDDDRYLLSVGRDRQWAVFERDQTQPQVYTLAAANQKGHSRMILDAVWAPTAGSRVFATAGRDKLVKLWQAGEEGFVCKATIAASHSVTAVAFLPKILHETLYLAVGTENGTISVDGFACGTLATRVAHAFDARLCPSRSITQLAWRRGGTGPAESAFKPEDVVEEESQPVFELAVASEDSSIRVYSISNLDVEI